MENQWGSRAKEDTKREQTRSLPNSNDGKRNRTRSSRSENQGSEEGRFHPDLTSQGIRGEKVWFNRNLYEQADNAYQNLLSAGSETPPVSSSSKDRVPAPWCSGLNETAHNNPKRRKTKHTPVPMYHISSSGVRPTNAHRLNPRGIGNSQKVAGRGSSLSPRTPLRKGTSMASLGAWDN